jgi:hypothetical protein
MGVLMKQIAISTVILIFLGFFTSVTADLVRPGDMTAESLRTHYRTFLDKKIVQAQAKIGYSQSKFDCMQRKAVLSALKAAFLEANGEVLLNTMVERRLGTNVAKLEHFINGCFYQYCHPRLITNLTSP